MTEDNDKSALLPDHQIRALIQLLSDENLEVAERVREEILALGPRAEKFLHEVLDQRNPRVREATDELLSYLREEEIWNRLKTYSLGNVDLEKGAFLLAQTASPDLDVSSDQARFDRMAQALKLKLGLNDSPDKVIEKMNHLLFIEHGFRGDTADYSNPENSYLNRVLDRGLGIPISLSAIYLFICRRLGLPFDGIGMPNHFIIRYQKGKDTRFLDPFHAGCVLTREACVQFLEAAGFGWREDYLAITPDREILARMIRNLITSYSNLGNHAKVERLSSILKCLASPSGAE